MSVFDDVSRFLESRLDEFLKAHPHLELQALEEQLRGQEEDAIRLLGDLKRREQQLETNILETAQDIQRWHGRIAKAKSANRQDLVKPAEEREAALLRQGNHLWGQMQGVKNRIEQTKTLQQQIRTRRQEVKSKIAEAQASAYRAPQPSASTTGWNQSPFSTQQQSLDPLEETFQRWETESELEDLKRQMGQ